MRKALSQISYYESSFLKKPTRFCLRVTIGMILAAFVAFGLHLDDPYWSIFPIVTCMSLYRGAAFLKSAERLLATIIGGLVGYFLIGLTINHLVFLCAGLLLFVTINQIFVFKSGHPYVFILASVTGALIIGSSQVPGDAPFNELFWRISTNTVGIVVIWIVSVLVFPLDAKKEMTIRMRRLINEWGEMLQKVSSTSDHLDNSIQKFHQQLEFVKSHYEDFCKEVSNKTGEQNAVRQIFMSLGRLWSKLQSDGIALQRIFSNDVFKSAIPSFFLLWESLLKGIASIDKMLEKKGTYFDTIYFRNELDNCLAEFEQFRDRQSETHQFSIEEVRSLHFFVRYLQDFVALFIKIEQSIQVYIGLKKERYHRQFVGFSVRNLDTITIKQSIKVGAAMVLSFLLWLLSDWPGGLQGLVSSYVVSSGKYFDDVLRVAKLRSVGCIIGGTTALSCLYFFHFSIYDIFFFIVAFGGVFSYLTIKSKKYTYVGLQANLAFAIALIQPEHSTLIEPALERLAGVFIGILSSLVIGLLIWPMFPRRVMQTLLPKVRQQFFSVYHGLLFERHVSDTEQAIAQLKSTLDEINQSLESRYELYGERDTFYLQYKKRVDVLNHLFQMFIMLKETINFEGVLKTAEEFNIDMLSLSGILCQRIDEGLEHYVVQGKKIKADFSKILSDYQEIIHEELLKMRYSEKHAEVGRERIAELIGLLHQYDNIFLLLSQRSML